MFPRDLGLVLFSVLPGEQVYKIISIASEADLGWITPHQGRVVSYCTITAVASLNPSGCSEMISAWAGLITESEQLLHSAFIYAQRHSIKLHLFSQYQENHFTCQERQNLFDQPETRVSYSKYLTARSKEQSALFSRLDFLCFLPSGSSFHKAALQTGTIHTLVEPIR